MPALLKNYTPELLGAAGGALVGGAGGYIEPQQADRAALRQDIADMERAHKSDELSGWDKLKNLGALEAKRRLLGTYELADKHPHAVAASTALAGAGIGAGMGRSVASLMGR